MIASRVYAFPFAPHATVHATLPNSSTSSIYQVWGGAFLVLTTHQVGVGYAARSFATIDAQGGFSMLVQQHSEVLVEVEVEEVEDILTHGVPAYSRTRLLTRFSLSYSVRRPRFSLRVTQLITSHHSLTHLLTTHLG